MLYDNMSKTFLRLRIKRLAFLLFFLYNISPVGGEDMQIKEKTSVFSRAVSALVLTAAFVVVFFLGYFIRFFTLDPAAKTLQWVKSEVKRNYYTEIPEKILKDATMNDLFYGEEKLLDAYSAYYSPEAYAASRQTDAGNFWRLT